MKGTRDNSDLSSTQEDGLQPSLKHARHVKINVYMYLSIVNEKKYLYDGVLYLSTYNEKFFLVGISMYICIYRKLMEG